MNPPLRVLQIVTVMDRGGIETMLMNHYRHLDRTKIQFDFLVHREEEGAFDKEIINLGGRIFHAPRIRPRNLVLYRKFIKTLIKDHPELKIFHSHLNSLSSIPLTLAKSEKIPVRISHSHVGGFHEQSASLIRRMLKKDLLKRQLPRVSTHFAACSPAAADFMFGTSAPYTYIRNAIDAQDFQFSPESRESIRKEFAVSAKTMVLGNVGNLNFAKNHVFLLKILNELINDGQDVKLMIVGKPGNMSSVIREYIESQKLQDKVILTGSRSDVSDLLQSMDVFVMPSVVEGLPVASIEAQASGLPCFFSDVITQDLAITDRCEFISLEKPPAAWAEQIASTFNSIRSETRGLGTLEQIRDAGYDSLKEASNLTEYYQRSLDIDN